MFTARDIMERVGSLIHDEDNTRWPLAELAFYINEASKAIILAKPDASSASRVMQLQLGTLQAVPQPVTDTYPAPLRLLSVPRNLKTTAESPRDGGRAIRPTTAALLDVQVPNWHDSSFVPFTKEVEHIVFDPDNPLEFYVYPGNLGTGIVEIITSELPEPVAATGEATDLASWEVAVGLPELYTVPMIDYVLSRCFYKDDLTTNSGKSQASYAQFAAALGIKIQIDRRRNPNARKQEPRDGDGQN